KSAAWRYPSEVEELKPYAPAVEEQPFDRFYKKPAQQAEDHKRFEPQPTAPAIVELENSSKKVYINFPGDVSTAPVKKSKPTETSPVVEIRKEEKPLPLLPDKTSPAIAAAEIPPKHTETFVQTAAKIKLSDK